MTPFGPFDETNPGRIADFLVFRYGIADALRVVHHYLNERVDYPFWSQVEESIVRSNPARVRRNGRKAEGKERIVASNITEVESLRPLPPSIKNYEDAMAYWYEVDLVPIYGEDEGKRKSKQQARKHVRAHSDLTELMSAFVNPGETVISVGAGLCDENAIAPKFHWVCLEYQPTLVKLAKQRDQMLNLGGEQRVWSAFDGDVSQCQHQSCGHLLGKLGALPRGKALYAKHFCGGGVDSAMFTAVHNRMPVIVAGTCCAHRYVGLSHAILVPEWDIEEYARLAKLSQNRTSEKGMQAVRQIDDLRERFLKKHGYVVYRGWLMDESGKPLPTGSWIIGVLPQYDTRKYDPQWRGYRR